MSAYLALILHAHLPFVRHPEHEHFLEEDWLFEAITETYVPLLRMMQRLVNDRVPFKLTMSLTPTLCAMLDDELLRERYLRHLDALIDLAGDALVVRPRIPRDNRLIEVVVSSGLHVGITVVRPDVERRDDIRLVLAADRVVQLPPKTRTCI